MDISELGIIMTPPTLCGKNVLITGGTGSFGKAFLRRCLADGAARVVIFSRDELKQSQVRESFPDPRLRFFIGDVRDYGRLVQAMRDVDICVHAAALKRIEVCEANPREAWMTNVLGTQNVADACVACGVERAIVLSTDKAASPNTLYGATKLAAERLWNCSNVYAAGMDRPTIFAATRYGNVLGSRGSVVELWRKQVAAGQPISVTNWNMTRFWMTLGDAVTLVCNALELATGGEVFVPKIGAATIARLANIVPGARNADVTGLRPGEKMHETLISEDEARQTVDAGDHYRILSAFQTWHNESDEPLDYPKVKPGFSYRSDTNEWQLTTDELRTMVSE